MGEKEIQIRAAPEASFSISTSNVYFSIFDKLLNFYVILSIMFSGIHNLNCKFGRDKSEIF